MRLQTQRRLERELGRTGAGGVGEPRAGQHWRWMTDSTPWGDFNPGTVDNHAMLQGNQAVIFVVKKNASRLRRLNEWIGDAVPRGVPVLVIDDEGDQASVNTGGNRTSPAVVDLSDTDVEAGANASSELAPSIINAEIRKLLDRFGQYAYVAYTATPFANVLIAPLVTDSDAGEDLYPRDFIINLPPPPRALYVGAERLFGQESPNPDQPDTDPLGVSRSGVARGPGTDPRSATHDTHDALDGALRGFVFPDPEDGPAGDPQQVIGLGVPCPIRVDLGQPPRTVRSRPDEMLLATVPEAPVDVDGNPLPCERNIHRSAWCTGNRHMYPVPQAGPMKRPTKPDLR